MLGDRGYDHDKYRRTVADLGVKPLIYHRGTEHGSGPRTQRRVEGRAFTHLHSFRRLRIRWDTRDDFTKASSLWGVHSSAGVVCAHAVDPSGTLNERTAVGSACCFLGGHNLIAVLEGPCADGVDGRQQGPSQSGELVLDP